MVDWEYSGLRDPARDLADVMTHPYQEDLLAAEDWQALLEPYLAGRSASDPRLAHRAHLYLAVFPVFWLAVSIRAGIRAARAEFSAIGAPTACPPTGACVATWPAGWPGPSACSRISSRPWRM
jgi:hypothetical protein